MTQLAPALLVTHVMSMSNEEILVPNPARSGKSSRAHFGGTHPRGPIIDQDGREIPEASLGSQFQGFRSEGFRSDGFRFDFGGANPFGNLTREQRLARLDAIAELLDIAFILPGTQIRYGGDGIIGLIPVVGDPIGAAPSPWAGLQRRGTGPA